MLFSCVCLGKSQNVGPTKDYRHKICGDSAPALPLGLHCLWIEMRTTIFAEKDGAFSHGNPTKRPVVEVPTAAQPDPDPPPRERRSARLFLPYEALAWLLSLGAVVEELSRDRAWLALSFLLVRWHPPFLKKPGLSPFTFSSVGRRLSR